jgi:hypothetical protein
LRVLKSTRSTPTKFALAIVAASIALTSPTSTTRAGPIKTSNDNSSNVALPAMKWAGGSTCVPVCEPKLKCGTVQSRF